MTAPARAWGLRQAPDRVVVLGALAVRCLPYLSQGTIGIQTGIGSVPGLSILCREFDERPIYHGQTGVYGWLRMPPGNHVLEVRDPSGFRLDRRVAITVVDRTTYRESLSAGMEAPTWTPPTVVDVPMRPSILHPWSSGRTVIQGVVRNAVGAPFPFARLEFAAVVGRAPAIVTHADGKGEYAAHLTGEVVQFHMPDPELHETEDDAELEDDFDRTVRVFRLKSAQAALATPSNPLRALPLDFDSLNPDAAASPYELPTSMQAITPTGVVTGAEHGVVVPFIAGQVRRIDFILS